MVKNITIFTTDTVPYCRMVKKYLGAKGHAFDEVNLDKHPHRQAEAFALSGALTTPVTIVTMQDDTKEVIVGYNLARRHQLSDSLKNDQSKTTPKKVSFLFRRVGLQERG